MFIVKTEIIHLKIMRVRSHIVPAGMVLLERVRRKWSQALIPSL